MIHKALGLWIIVIVLVTPIHYQHPFKVFLSWRIMRQSLTYLGPKLVHGSKRTMYINIFAHVTDHFPALVSKLTLVVSIFWCKRAKKKKRYINSFSKIYAILLGFWHEFCFGWFYLLFKSEILYVVDYVMFNLL